MRARPPQWPASPVSTRVSRTRAYTAAPRRRPAFPPRAVPPQAALRPDVAARYAASGRASGRSAGRKNGRMSKGASAARAVTDAELASGASGAEQNARGGERAGANGSCAPARWEREADSPRPTSGAPAHATGAGSPSMRQRQCAKACIDPSGVRCSSRTLSSSRKPALKSTCTASGCQAPRPPHRTVGAVGHEAGPRAVPDARPRRPGDPLDGNGGR